MASAPTIRTSLIGPSGTTLTIGIENGSSETVNLSSLSNATNITGLSDALVEDNSYYLGNDPSGTTSSAEYNVAVGGTALDAVTSGDQNVAVGYDALTANTTGSNNVAVGPATLAANTTGTNNTAIGASADVASTVSLTRQRSDMEPAWRQAILCNWETLSNECQNKRFSNYRCYHDPQYRWNRRVGPQNRRWNTIMGPGHRGFQSFHELMPV